jgi:dGTPase
MINQLIEDVIETSRENIEQSGVTSLAEVRLANSLIEFSAPIRAEADDLKRFLSLNLYRHFQVERMTHKARRIVRELFEAFSGEPRLLPPEHQQRVEREGARAIADYIAGMTDRYAIREHRRIFAIAEL